MSDLLHDTRQIRVIYAGGISHLHIENINLAWIRPGGHGDPPFRQAQHR